MNKDEVMKSLKEVNEEIEEIIKSLDESTDGDGDKNDDPDEKRAKLEKLEKRSNELISHKHDLESQLKEIEEREVKESKLKELRGMLNTTKTIEKRGTEMEKNYNVNGAEYRSAWVKDLMGKELNTEERAALTSANAVIPTGIAEEVYSIVEASPLVDAVDVSHITGYVTFPVETAASDAAWVAMGTAATDGTDTLTPITLNAYKLIKTVEITADISAMSVAAFEKWIVARLADKILKAVNNAILNGTGASQPSGIFKVKNSATGTFTKAGMTYKDLMKVLAALPTGYAANGTLVMNRALFYGDVLGMTDSNGQKVCVADAQSPAKFNVLGYPVIIDDNCPADKLLFGDLKAYKFNFASDTEVKPDASVGFRSGSVVWRAMTLADGNLGDARAIVRFDRATA
jgi:HK97 family phage major capsid protein|nr:MAG TPA: major capsid protein [Caudoviricetes sp.]